MSEILLAWLNTEVDLSKRITDMEKDFSSGFLLGELLYKFNQLTNFREFLEGNDRNAKIKNFTILQGVLKNIGISFDMNAAKEVMEGKKGVILKLLYQIRSKLEKKGVNPDSLSMKKSNQISELYSSMKFRKEISPYDDFSRSFFSQQLQAKTKSQKEINLERHLAKFEKFKKGQDEMIQRVKGFDEMRQKAEIEDRIKQMKSEGARYRAFQQQFEQKGIDDWKQNILRMKEMQKKDLDYQVKEAEKYKTVVFNSIKSSQIDCMKKIDSFENNLKQNQPISKEGGINNNSSSNNNFNNEQISSPLDQTRKFYKGIQDLSDKLRDSIFQKIMNDQSAKKERNRRRRKIIVEQSKAQLEIENKRREEQYIEKLYKQSNQEKQLSYETYRVIQVKNIISENRSMRDEMYAQRLELDLQIRIKNEEEFLNFHKENYEIEIQKEEDRRRDLEIALMQKKRSNNTDQCKNMVDLIIDIAEEAYVYQQTNDSENIDPRVWREWTQIFINNQSVLNREVFNQGVDLLTNQMMGVESANASMKPQSREGNSENEKRKDSIGEMMNTPNAMSNYNTKYGNTFYSGYTNEPNYSLIDKILDDCEFVDYLNFLGQWQKNLIPQNAFVVLNLHELMTDTPSQDKIDPKAKTKIDTKKKVEDEYKEDDVENLTIPKDTLMNTLFGDLIDILIDMKYFEEEQSNRSFLFSQIPLKMTILGHDFSGKKTQAKILSENFPIKIYTIENILAKALDLLEKLESPLDLDKTEYKMMRTNQIEQLTKERQLEEKKYVRIKELAYDIRNLLKNGDAITDDIYVDLLIEFIKIDFPEKNEEELFDEIFNRVKEKEKINEEFEKNKEDKIKRPKAYGIKEQELTQQLMRISLESSKGFVIVNFPNTYNQAKLLEKRLSSYIPDNEKPLTQAATLKNNFNIILDKTPKVSPPKKLIKGGLDYMFLLNVPPSECSRRAVGRRIVPQVTSNKEVKSDTSSKFNYEKQEKVIYHMEDNLPPTNSDICEKMVKLEDRTNSDSSLVTRHLSFENTIPQVIEFYQDFGLEKYKLYSFITIDGNKNRDYVLIDIIEHINRLLEINEQKEIDMVNEEERSVSEINAIQIGNVGNSANNMIHIGNINKTDLNINNTIPNASKLISSEEVDNINNINPMNNECEEENPIWEYNRKIETIKRILSKDLAEILLKIWSRIFENYIKECKSIFKFIRLQRDALGINYNLICQKFIEFLKRPSKKQNLLLDFQLKYNKFMEDYPDLIDDPVVKEEHHQSVDDLNDKIHEIIETRKTEAVEERKKIMTAGWIENEMEKLYLNLERLYQVEVDKLIGSLQIIRDYYHNLDNKPLIELPFQSIDILKEEIDPTPLESENDPNLFPKVEKLHKTVLKVQFQYDEALIQAEKKRQEKLQEANKKNKEVSKISKDKKNVTPDQVEEKKENPPVYEEEMKQAIKNEKAKYRFRVTLIKFWGLNCLKNMRKIANTIYGKLDDWIVLSMKAENEALNQLTQILKNTIEKEERVKYELELDTFDVIINFDVQNYIELPPKPKPAKEIIDTNKFNINQLRIIIDELKTYEIKKDIIRTSTFIDIFIKKYISSKNDNDVYYGIPQSLKSLSFHNYFKFIRHLDNNCTDYLNLRLLGTYFCLLNTRVCSHQDESSLRKECEKYINLYEDDLMTKDAFVKIPMWFDSEEDSPTLQMHENYNRPMRLKEILFDINKDDDSLISINDLLRIFTLKAIGKDGDKFKLKTYFDVLFN